MAMLNDVIAKIAAVLTARGIPAGQATLYAFILLYLLTTVCLAIFLVYLFIRARNRKRSCADSPPERES